MNHTAPNFWQFVAAQLFVIGTLCCLGGCTNSNSKPTSAQQAEKYRTTLDSDAARKSDRLVDELLKRTKTPEEIAALKARLDRMTTDEIQAENDKLIRQLLEKSKTPEEIAAMKTRLDGMTTDEIQAENDKLIGQLLENRKNRKERESNENH